MHLAMAAAGSGLRQNPAVHPMASQTGRISASIAAWSATWSTTTRLPFESVSPAGATGSPVMAEVCMLSCGNARAIRSPSTTGRPSGPESLNGIRPFEPPISAEHMAASSGGFSGVSAFTARKEL